MLTKTAIALSALLIVGATSASFAYETPENKIGDRYPLLEQTYRPIATSNVGARRVMVRQVVKLDQFTNEVPENKIGDRYPFLEQTVQFAGVNVKARRAVKPLTFADKSLFDRQSMRAVF